MKATKELHDLGQGLWLDNITRDLLTTGTLKHYIDELSETGLTSNPMISDHAIKNSTSYDVSIRQKLKERKSGEELFFELALEDITAAADLFRPIGSGQAAWTGGCRWRCFPCCPTTRRAHSTR
jgi:transaldolase